MTAPADTMDKIVALCRRRGFIFGSSEIYGGIGGFWDYGPLGTELKRNVKDAWWQDMVRNPPLGPNGVEYAMVGLDTSIIMNPKVWEASGHVGGFADLMVECSSCRKRYRADKVFLVSLWGASHPAPDFDFSAEADDAAQVREMLEPAIKRAARQEGEQDLASRHAHLEDDDGNLTYSFGPQTARSVLEVRITQLLEARSGFARRCPGCRTGLLGEARPFNLMLGTNVGALVSEENKAYLRPETAQGIFVNFKNVLDSSRVKLPFGIAQIGKSFRNEINPRNYTFRSREFEQYEIEFFCHPSEAGMWYEYWRDLRHRWYVGLGLQSEKLRLREHDKDELAHYAAACADIEYDFPFGMSELEGIANRTDFDLKAHIDKSGKDLSYFDDQRKERYVPYVIEPSGGVDRSVLAFLTEAYTVDENRASPEFMRFHPRLAPIKAAVFPLVAKDGLPELAEPIYRAIKQHYPCQYDAKQSIGKRYARMDEAGTPFCFTIDGQTKQDGTVTVRNRDDASQIRIAIGDDAKNCVDFLHDQLQI